MAEASSPTRQGEQSPSADEEPVEAGTPSAPGELAEALTGLLKVFVRRGREEIGRVASTGRVRLELRQLRRDRDVMYQKLGREVQALLEGGEIDHPGLTRGVERIAEMDERIAAVESGAADPADPDTDKPDPGVP